jgi:hypothetical protein
MSQKSVEIAKRALEALNLSKRHQLGRAGATG